MAEYWNSSWHCPTTKLGGPTPDYLTPGSIDPWLYNYVHIYKCTYIAHWRVNIVTNRLYIILHSSHAIPVSNYVTNRLYTILQSTFSNLLVTILSA